MPKALRLLLLIWLIPVGALLWLKGQDALLIQRLTVDLTASAGVPPYTGLLSNAGITLWLVSGSILLFTAAHSKGGKALLLPGILSLMLGLDDGLMLHETVLPGLLGIHDRLVQPALYCVYAALLGLCLSKRRPQMTQPQFLVLLAALLCLGASVALDLLRDSHWIPARHPLMLDEALFMWWEDGLKLLGIVAWSGYWIGQASEEVVTGNLEQSSPG